MPPYSHTNDPCGRQYDQMTQAARSVPANIAEGNSRHSTSKETEMRLTDVARASLAESASSLRHSLVSYNDGAQDGFSNRLCLIKNLSLPKPRMIRRQSIAQQLIGNVRVDFSCTHAGVAEHLLDGQQIGTAFQKMGGETVSEGVRADGLGDAVLFGQVLYD